MPSKADSAVARTIGIDTDKNTLHMVGLNAKGAIVLREKVSRTRIAARFVNLPPCLVGIEAGMASHHVARELVALGHEIARLCVADVYEGNGNVAHSVRITSSGNERLLPIRSTRLRSALANHFECSFRNRHIDNATPVIRSQRGGAMTTGGLARLLTHLYQMAGIESGSSRSGRRTLRAHLENFGFTRA